jgi:predicted nucleotide-binding protein with TIR-like domain
MASKKDKPKRVADDEDETAGSRSYLSQTDVPAFALAAALRVPESLDQNFARNPTKPLRVAQAMEMAPGSSRFRMLCGASIAYGLTAGGYNAEQISLTPLGRRIVAPTKEGDDLAARREAILRPRVPREFLTRYNEAKLPPQHIACNVLEELGVPQDKAAEVYTLILEGAESVGFLREVKGQKYVDLDSTIAEAARNEAGGDALEAVEEISTSSTIRPPKPAATPSGASTAAAAQAPAVAPLKHTSRVFITHGKNQDIVNQLKELLSFGGFTPVVAIESETVSKPVPDKVMGEMRTCSAAVIHVGAEKRVMDTDGKEHLMLNQNVLIEIGAAMALYDRKFILLVEKGATLPSNLQGLYEVRYEGGKLDYESTMRLLKAFNDFRN